MFVQDHQFDGTEWRKSNLLFGYHEIWDENLGGTATGVTWDKNSSVVPAGELWVLQGLAIANTSGNTGWGYLRVVQGSGAILQLAYTAGLDQYEPMSVNGNWVLGEGSYARVYVTGLAAGNAIPAGVIGYKMKLDM